MKMERGWPMSDGGWRIADGDRGWLMADSPEDGVRLLKPPGSGWRELISRGTRLVGLMTALPHPCG
ncbi:MAG TPA: hypothetical protein VEZ17_10455 [Chitinophagaceae bacterium]|nr:hypothetical protein [Chitinophagaceae bacterium]